MAESERRSLKELLFETVEGFEDLLVLVWFYDTGRPGSADLDGVAKGAGLSPDDAAAALERLVARGILAADSADPRGFSPTRDPKMREIAERIASEYRTSAGQVMKLLTENAIERVKTAALRTFAECFRIRGPR